MALTGGCELQRDEKPKTVWRNRDYLLLMSGQSVSLVGTQMSQFAFPLLVLALTGQPGWAGLSAALVAIPYFFLSLPVGALLDRWNRKSVMILCDVGRAMCLGSIPLMLFLGRLTLLQLCICALLEGVLYTFFDIALSSALPCVVAEEQIQTAAAQETTVRSTAFALGPALGGFFFGIGRALPALADAVSYAVSIISLLLIKGAFQEEREVQTSGLWIQIQQGFLWVWERPLIRFLAVLAGVGNGLDNSVWLLFVIIAVSLHAPAWAIGTVFGAAGVSGILAALLADPIQRRFSLRSIMLVTQWATVLLLPVFLFVPNVVYLGVATTAIVFASSFQGTVQYAYRLSVIPDAYRGRANSIFRLVAYAGPPLALWLTGLSLQFAGVMVTVLVITAIILSTAVFMSINTHLRQTSAPGVAGSESAPDQVL